MFDARELEAVSARLHSYHNQMVAVSQALEALRTLADALVGEMANDAAIVSACAHRARADETTNLSVSLDQPISFDEPEPVENTVIAATQEKIAAVVALSSSAEDEHFARCEIAPTPKDASIAPDAADKTDTAASDRIADAGIETLQAAATTSTGVMADATATATAPPTVAKVVDIASRRKSKTAAPFRRRAVGMAACLLLAGSVTVGMHTFMQTDVAQRLLELGACDGEVLSANRDCAFLAWMLL